MLDPILNRWRTSYAKWTVYTRRRILQQLLGRLSEHGAPAIKLPHTKMPEVRPTIATPAEIAAALTHARPHERLLVLLCWQTALRSNAALHASTSNWNREEHTLAVLEKGGKTRTVPLTPEIEEMLAIADRTAKPAQSAIEALHGKKLSRHAMNMTWWRLKQKAGINPELRLHDLRRTTLTNLYLATRDLRAVQAFAAHESLMSTIRYIAPLSEGNLRGLQESLYKAKPITEVKQ